MDTAFVGGAVVLRRDGRTAIAGGRSVAVSRSARVPLRMSTEPDFGDEPTVSEKTLEDLDDEKARKKKEADRLRAAEKFIEIDEGAVECRGCGYVYEPSKGDNMLGIPKGISFDEFPADFRCPMCNSPRSVFFPKKKVIAGFAENQAYGFGGNSMTEGQKSGLIFGGLLVFLVLFLGGYLLN